MSTAMTTDSIRWAIRSVKENMVSVASELNALDGALGDGDLGITLSQGFLRLQEDASNLPDDVGMALLQCAQAFTRVTASTYGTLLATGMMAAAKVTRGRNEVPWTEVPQLLGAALKSMSDRGKGELGDKTVLDALNAVRLATEGLDQPTAQVKTAIQAVDQTLTDFRGHPFRRGRARIFGDKGLELDDPGMVAFKRMIESLI